MSHLNLPSKSLNSQYPYSLDKTLCDSEGINFVICFLVLSGLEPAYHISLIIR